MIRLILFPVFKLYIFFFNGGFLEGIYRRVSFFKPIIQTRDNETPINPKQWLKFKILGGHSGGAYFPIHPTSKIDGSWRNIVVGIDASPTVSPGCYVGALGKLEIGDYSQVAPHVGILTSNHFMFDIRKHIIKDVVIGKYCRIGMKSIIHPGVVLGDFVTVAAGSVVKDSFPNGYCVISGNPAIIVEDFSGNQRIMSKFIEYRNQFEYNGFIPNAEFENYRKQNLNF